MIDIVTGDAIKKIQEHFNQIQGEEFNRAVSKAINRQLTPSKNLAIKDICATYNLEPDYFKDKNIVNVKYSGNRSLTGQILVNVKRISLTAFDPVQVEKGVEVEVTRGKKELIKNAFNATFSNGGFGVFARGEYAKGKFDWRRKRIKAAGGYHKVNGNWRPKNNDLTINNLKTVSHYSAFVREDILKAISKRTAEQFPKRLTLELSKIMKGRTGF